MKLSFPAFAANFAFARLDRAPIASLNRLWAAMLVVLLLIGGALHPAQAAPNAKVALLHAEDSFYAAYAADVKTKLMGTGRFAQVDLIDVSSGNPNPTLTQLQAYDAVLTWSDFSYADAASLGGVLADYADSGKRVVVAVFASDPTNYSPKGRLASGGYLPFIAAPGGNTFGTQQSLVADIANDPLLAGVNSFNGGSASVRQEIGLATGAVQVAHWTDNLPLVAHKEMGSASIVGLNFFPPSSSVQNNLWDASTDGAALLANALLASLNKAPVIATNTGLRAPQAATATITAAMLNATDADNDTPLTYTVTTAPTKGTLGLSGAATTTFTQADIAAGRVSYTPTGSSGTTDTFAFTVNDGKGGVATGNFAIVTTEKQALIVTTDSDNSTDSDNETSLREAIAYAATLSGTPEITFNFGNGPVPQDGYLIKLTAGELGIAHNLNINGPDDALLTVSGNNASRVFNVSGGTVEMDDLVIANGNGNATNTTGGCITNRDATLSLTRCVVTGGTADLGGGISNLSATLNLTNCTLTRNTASGAAQGGALINSVTATANLKNCTITDNQASRGGGIFNFGVAVNLSNSIVAGNSANTGPDIFGSITSQGFNLIGKTNDSGGFVASDLTGTTATPRDAKFVLDANSKPDLADNGGGTLSIALQPTSPAVNAGGNALVPVGVTTDQRGAGFPRVKGGRVDIGAFEVQNVAPVAANQNVSTTSGVPINITLVATDADNDPLTYSVVTPPANGKVTIAGNVATYTSNAGYVGPDSFTFKANDTKADSNTATVNINVVAGPAPPESGLVVTTLADIQASDGVTSLREAVDAANRDGADSPITFAVSGTIKLTGGELTLVNDGKVSIVGSAAGVTINAGGKSRVFNIVSGADATLSGLNITGGNNSAILNDGALTINGSALFNNTSGGNGGAILNNGALSIANTTIAGNNASGNGGAIFNSPTATLSSLNSTLVANAATAGGGIFKGKSLSLTNTLVVGNTGDNLSGVADAGGNNITAGTNAAAGLDAAGLKDNGGPVKTIALTTRGTAVNAGDNAAAKGLTTDARGAGFPRIVSGKVDVGAFESAFGNRAPSLNNATFSTSINVGFSHQLEGNDADGDSLTYSRAGGTLPDGVTLSSTGLLVGTPTKVGRYDFQINVFDGTDVTVARFIVIVSSNSDGIGPVITRAVLNASYTRDEFAALVYRGTVRDVAPPGVTPGGVAQVTFQLRRNSDGFAYSGNEMDGFTSNVNLGYFPAFLSEPTPDTAGARDFRRTFGANGFVPSASVLKPGGYSLVIAAKDVAGNFSVEVVPVTITAATASAVRGAKAASGGNS